MKFNADLKTSIIFIVIAICLLGFGIYSILNPHTDYLETTAVITDIQEDYDVATETYEYRAFIDYEVDGKEYKNVEFGTANAGDVGKQITIRYNPNNPGEIESTNSEIFSYISAGVGALLLIAGVVFLIKNLKERKSADGTCQ